MKRAIALLLLGLSASLAAGELRLGCWNLRNYLLTDRWTGEAWRFDYPKPEAEKARLRQQLLRLRADVLFLQEVGSERMLMELQRDLADLGLDYAHAHFGKRADRKRGLAVLSHLPLAEVIFHGAVPLREKPGKLLRRGLQEVRLRTAAGELIALHVHLKSRYSRDPADPESRRWRKAELAAVRDWAKRRKQVAGPRVRFLLVGDFNTPFEDALFAGLRGEPVSWRPVPVSDGGGASWTYHHRKTDRYSRIDGFWTLARDDGLFKDIGLFPEREVVTGGSDHRLVGIRMVDP